MQSLIPGDLPTLSSDRLRLRQPAHADVDSICALANDWEVTRWMGRLPFPYLRQDALFFVETIAREEPVWVIERRQDGNILGGIGLRPVAESEAMELGYWLGQPHWSHGYASEAARTVLSHAFGAVHVPDIVSGYFDGNGRSAHVLGKLGFTQTGTSARMCAVQGAELPHIDMALSRDRWLALSRRA